MSLDRNKFQTYARDPLAFCLDLEHGGIRFGAIADTAQVAWLKAIAPALIALTKGQQPDLRKFMLEATKGFGKDLLLAMAVTWLVVFSRRTLLIQIAADDFDQAAEYIKSAKSILRNNQLIAQRYDIQATKTINDRTETTAEVLTRDKLGSHGARPDLLIINELSHISDEEFAATLMDNATKMPSGLVVLAGNSGFLDTWQWRWRELARTSADWHFFQFTKPAPWINATDLAEAEQRNTRSRYRRLFWGEWASGTGDAIDNDDLAACTKHSGPMTDQEKGWTFLAGLDIGTKHDHSAFVLLAVDAIHNRIRLANVTRWKPIRGRINLGSVRSAVLAAHTQFNLHRLYFDPSQAVLMSEDLARWQVPVEEMSSTGKNLNTMATSIIEAFRGQTLEIYPDAGFIADLRKLKIVEKAFGYKLEASSDANGHADSAFALALCLPAAVELAASGIAGEYSVAEAMDHPAFVHNNPAQYGIRLDISGQRRHLSQTIQLSGGRFDRRRGERWEQGPRPFRKQ